MLKFLLRANERTTILEDERLSPSSKIGFDALTANAAAEKSGGIMVVLEAHRGNGTWIVTHANNPQTDRAFRIAFLA